MSKNKKHSLYLSHTEARLVLQSLIGLKNKLIREGRYTDCVDELIVKMTKAPVRKIKTT